MCGIVGFAATASFDHKAILTQMMGRLKHRGPDAEGTHFDRNNDIYLGHRRLSIIDTSKAGTQPMANEDGTIWIITNGEFYNYQLLRQDLIKRGHVFRSKSDSEVLVHGYEEWNTDVFLHIDGIYAVAIWDRQRRQLIIARDPLGVKPLVYMEIEAGFFFSSEAQAFHALPPYLFPRIFDTNSLQQLICFQYIYEPHKTAYRDVRRLLPGTFRIYDSQEQCSVSLRFWSLSVNSGLVDADFKTAVNHVETFLAKTVKSQMVSDVPIGVLLSGGLDSSVIAALAQKSQKAPILTFTAGFEHALDERPFAKQVADHLKTKHHEIIVDPRKINHNLDKLVPLLDDLTSLDGGMFTIHLICNRIREYGIKVLLVGEGSDELFGGYSWFGLSQLPFSVIGNFIRSILFYYCTSRMLPGFRNFRHLFNIAKMMRETDETDIFRQVSHFEITRQLPNHYLMKMDHATMSCGIEARVPFLAKEVVETVYSLPRSVKLHGKWFSFRNSNEKYVLKEFAKKILPPDIVSRKKRGFSIPMPEVLKGNITKMQDLLLSSDSIAMTFFSRKEIEKLLEFKTTMYAPMHKHREFLCWRLLLIEIWRRHYGVSL